MIKILHVISDKNIGGAGRLLLNLLSEADRKKFDFAVVLPHDSMLTPRVISLEANAIESQLSFRELLSIVKEENPDIVHTHSAAVARVAAKLCGVSTVVNTKHCAEEVTCKTPLRKRIPTRVFDALFTDHTIATAEYAKDRLVADGIPPCKTSVIINGSLPIKELSVAERLAARESLGYCDKDFLVGMVARLEQGKGHEYFIEAAGLCQNDYPRIKFLIAGSGSLEEKLKSSARGLDNLKFLGFISDVTEIMNILDVNTNCSYVSETSSLSLSEGMSVGVIPIVSDCGGNAFMARDCGMVFPKKDSAALADILKYLYRNPKEKMTLSAKAKHRFNSIFVAKEMAKETENLYLKLLK